MNLSNLDTTHNRQLRDVISDRIRQSGPISFAEFYELAMYHPRHGYYFNNDPAQDFHSSPNVHPVFAACLMRQLVDLWRILDRPARFDVFEAGAGSLRLASDILEQARAEESDFYDALRYVAQDVTLTTDTAAQRLDAAGIAPHKLEIAQSLPANAGIEGCILSNELLDALPFRRLRKNEDGQLVELLVGMEHEQFTDVEAEPRPEILTHFEALGLLPAEGCEAEVSLTAPAWISRVAQALRRGYVLTLDYGYEAAELYAPWRRRGTLLTFYRQVSGDDPFQRIGRQDITASVDFTSLRRAGEAAGLKVLGGRSQSQFLAALGIGDALIQKPQPAQLEAYYELRRSVLELTDPAGLGRVTVLIMAKDVPDQAPLGLRN